MNELPDYDTLINLLKKQHQVWVIFSLIIYVIVIVLIILWDVISEIKSMTFWWSAVVFVLILSISWWYWTMDLVMRMIDQHTKTIELLRSITTELKEVRKDLTKYDE